MTIVFRVDRFEGEPKIFLDENGADMNFQGIGQPIMDAGLENTVFISLFTRRKDKTTGKPWCGNTLFSKPAQKIGGLFMEKADQSVTLSTLLDLEAAAESDLEWLKEENIASDIGARASIPTGKDIMVVILITHPSGDIQQIVLLKNGNNWIIQATDPAHLKV